MPRKAKKPGTFVLVAAAAAVVASCAACVAATVPWIPEAVSVGPIAMPAGCGECAVIGMGQSADPYIRAVSVFAR